MMGDWNCSGPTGWRGQSRRRGISEPEGWYAPRRALESVLFYSDGLVEAHDPHYEMFGFPRLRRLVAEHDEERLLVEFLMDELSSFVGEDWEQEDDITLVTLRRSMARS